MTSQNNKKMKLWERIDPVMSLLVILMLIVAGITVLTFYLDQRNDNKYCDGEQFERVTHEIYNCCYEQKICRSNNHGGCYWDTEEVCNGRRFKE